MLYNSGLVNIFATMTGDYNKSACSDTDDDEQLTFKIHYRCVFDVFTFLWNK